jgi:hypothetical protein
MWQLGATKGRKRSRDQFETAEVDSTSASEPRLASHQHVEPDVWPLSMDTLERNPSVNKPAFGNDLELKSPATDSCIDPINAVEVVKLQCSERESGGSLQIHGVPADVGNDSSKVGGNSVNYSQKVHL